MIFSVKLHNGLGENTLTHCGQLFLDPLIPPCFHYIDCHRSVSAFFFDRLIGRINAGTFGAVHTFGCSVVSESSLPLSSSISESLSASQLASLSIGLSKSPIQLSQFLVSEMLSGELSSATTLVCVRDTQVFQTALTALMEPRTLGQRITCCPSPRPRFVLHTCTLTLWWRLRTIRRTRVLHSSQGLQLCWSLLHNASRCWIIATNRSTIFKTYAFCLYSELCIYVSIKLPIYTQYIWTGSTRWLSAIRGALEDDDKYVLPVAQSTSVTPVSLYTRRRSSTMYLKAVIEQVWRCTLRLWSSKFGDAIGDWDWVNSEMHWEAVIERVWRCNWRPRLSELGDALRGRDRARLDVHLEAEIEWTQRCTPTCDRPGLEMHLQQAVVQGDQRCTWRWSI